MGLKQIILDVYAQSNLVASWKSQKICRFPTLEIGGVSVPLQGIVDTFLISGKPDLNTLTV